MIRLGMAHPARSVTRRISTRIRNHINRSGVPGGPPRERDFSLGVPFDFQSPIIEKLRVGAVVHIFHSELAREFADALLPLDSVFGVNAFVMVTTDTPEKADTISTAFSNWSSEAFEVRIVENRGRDIAPKLTTYVDKYCDFDLLLFLHSKITERSSVGGDWRRKLLWELVGSDAIVRSIVTIFGAESSIGMVFPQHFDLGRRWTGWEANFRRAKQLTHRWGIKLNRRGELDFPSGSMFWVRPSALQPLISLRLSANDFPPEPLQNDGTLGHAIERLFALSTEVAGYKWYKIAAPKWYSHRDTIITPRSEEELRWFLSTHQRQLLKTMVR